TLRPSVARLNADGTLDTSFSVVQLDGPVYAIGIQLVNSPLVNNAEKLLIGGAFTANTAGSSGFARLEVNGALDTTFNSNVGGVDGAVKCITMHPAGSALIGGTFAEPSGLIQVGAALYDRDGHIISQWDTCNGIW